MKLSRLIPAVLVWGLAFGLAAQVLRPVKEAEAVAVPEAPPPRASQLITRQAHTIVDGDTFGGLMQAWEVPGVSAILEAAKPVTDLRSIRLGRTLSLRRIGDEPVALEYPLDEDRTLMVWISGDEPAVQVDEVQYERREGRYAFEVDVTLWDAALGAGLRPADIVTLARIFEYQVDFNTEIRGGARFVGIGEDLYLDGERVKLGVFDAVRFTNDGREMTAFRFLNPNDPEAEEGWYDADGEPVKRPFLRSPLEFSRVTSGFNPRRYHPVLKKRRPHNGVDFGAPSGTPVRAVADGKVTRSGRNGGYGNHVRLDHQGPYESSYSHLTRIDVRRGEKVRQGQIVGTVGSTGLATGPHLHYELLVSGKHVNPLREELPTGTPLAPEDLPAFELVRDQWLPLLRETELMVGGVE